MTALIVWRRFSASLKARFFRIQKLHRQLPCSQSRTSGRFVRLLWCRGYERRAGNAKLAIIFSGFFHDFHGYAIGGEQPDALLPDLFRLSHLKPRHPYKDNRGRQRRIDIIRARDFGAGFWAIRQGHLVDFVGSLQRLWGNRAKIQSSIALPIINELPIL